MERLNQSCPVLVHAKGFAEGCNQPFVKHFGFEPMSNKRLRIRELLWSLGIQDPLAGMISDGVTFDRCDIPPLAVSSSLLRLRQIPLPGDRKDERDCRFMLIMTQHLDSHGDCEKCSGQGCRILR